MRQLRFAMIGGGNEAFIGAVHRMAIRLDGQAVTIGGALSSTPDRCLASGRALGFADDRIAPDWRTLIARESERPAVPTDLPEPQWPADGRVDAVAICTPNDTHAEIAIAALDAGLHVVLDKPMCVTQQESDALVDAADRALATSGATLTITYNYSGYPLVREARSLIRSGRLGIVRKVFAEYLQGWLSTPLEATGQKQASWRVDPKRSGAGALGDIGTHAFQMAEFLTGELPSELCADVHTFVGGRAVDDDAAVMLRYASGTRATLACSQVCFGEENNHTIRVFGTEGALWWRQEEPNHLFHREADGTIRVISRGVGRQSPEATEASRIPPGHPEAFIEAFANIYRGAFDRIRGIDSTHARLAPDVRTGAHGVRFIHAALESRGSWVAF